MNDRLLIIGAGGHGKVVADIAMKMNIWDKIAFLDDDESIKTCMAIDVIGKSEDALKYKDDSDLFVAIGNNFTREKIQENLQTIGASIATLIHPSAILGTDVMINKGTAIMAGVVINCSSRIGKGCIINTAASLDHDCVIEDYAHLSPGVRLSGTVNIGKSTWLGIGSIVGNNIGIAFDCIIGAGAVVIKDITESGTYVGVPARMISQRDPKQWRDCP